MASRHRSRRTDPRSEDGLSLIGVILALLVVLAVFLLLGGSLRELGSMAAGAGDRVTGILGGGTQARAMREMQAVAEANARMRVEHGRFAESLHELSQLGYRGFSTTTDPWGHPWDYDDNGRSWSLRSFGADGRPGPPPPPGWRMGHEECDLVMRSGAFTQAPKR